MSRAPRGQAVVELSLLLIVLVPIVFYTLFLDDLLRHRLDLQEAVISSPWDFGAIDPQLTNRSAQKNQDDLTRYEQQSWCDLTSAYNSHDPAFDCDSSNHHKAFTAHACWKVEGGEEVTCSTDTSTGMIDLMGGVEFNRGGLTTCSARLGVLNYFLVQKALQSFSHENLTDKQRLSGDVHSHDGAAAANVFLLEKQQFAVMHDTWAMKTPDDVDSATDLVPELDTHTFKGRIQWYYGAAGLVANAFVDAETFLNKANSEKLIDGLLAGVDGSGDLLPTIHLSFNKTPGHAFGLNTQHTTSAWSDSRVSSTHGRRVNSYFGLPESTW